MSKVCISYDCPMINKLNANSDGNFDCSKCQKKVYNFTQMNDKEFEEQIPIIHSKKLCGIYREDQISKNSKLNWRTRMNLQYDRWRQSSRLLYIPALFLGLFIVLMGCKTRKLKNTRHVGGFVNNYTQPSHSEQNQKQDQNTNYTNVHAENNTLGRSME